jgi:hypothetical protein
MLRSGDQRHDVRRAKRGAAVRRAGAERRLANSAPMPRASEWHYADIDYGGNLLGLLVQTGDEAVARREAEEFCDALGNCAKVLDVRRAVVQ